MRIQEERNGEMIKEQPAFAHTFRHVYQFILQATDGDTAAASAMFQRYLAGELSEELLALSRRWVRKDQRSGKTRRRASWAGRRRLQAAGLAPPLRPHPRLAQDEEPRQHQRWKREAEEGQRAGGEEVAPRGRVAEATAWAEE